VRRCKIVTIEDPIEFVHEDKRAIVVQQEVLTDTHSYHRALIHVLRQDPEVIVVGEIPRWGWEPARLADRGSTQTPLGNQRLLR
jgi:Tfp pilus assembly pilus retraction ATPase PilT